MSIFTAKEAGEFSLAKAIRLAASDELRGCLEAEMLEEAAVRDGKLPGTNTLTIPFELLAASHRRDMTSAGASGSNYLVSSSEVQAAIDVLRPWSVTAKAGVRMLPGLRGDTVIPRVSGTIAGEWLPTEASPITVSQPTIGAINMTPKAAMALAKYSRLMKVAVPALDAYLARDLSRSVGAMLDRAVLIGSGVSGEPQGIANTNGIITASGTALSWATLQTVIENLASVDADENTLAFIGSPSVRRILSQRERLTGSGVPIWNNKEIAGFGAHVTTGTAAGSMTVGAFDGVTIGIWGEALQLEADPVTFFKSGIVQFRCWLTADVAVAVPGSFAVIPSIT
jgi:HK97 family phage major capsid protein